MKVKLGDLIIAKPGFEEFLANTCIPIGVTFKITRLMEAIVKELESFEKFKQDLFKKYGDEKTKEETGETFLEVPAERTGEFFKELDDLAGEEVTLIYEPFSLINSMDKEDLKKLKISSKSLLSIEKFFLDLDKIITE